MGNEPSKQGWSNTYIEIKASHDAAYKTIQEAINLDEGGIHEEAIEKYKKGIEMIDIILRIQVTCPDAPDATWEAACKMIQKMKKTRAEILMRVGSLQKAREAQNGRNQAGYDQPPSYDEATSSDGGDVENEVHLVTYSDLAGALNRLQIDAETPMEAEVIYMYDGVQLYFIAPGGDVTSSLQPQTLKIILVESEGPNVPRGILQVGDWVYPLIPGASPCYRNSTTYNAFLLPNVYSDVPGSSVAIILPPDTDESAYELLESILYGIVGKPKPPQELSVKISDGIVDGASFISRGIVTGAEKLGTLLNTTTPKLIKRMNSADQPTAIPRKVSKTMRVASHATNKAVQVTGFVADQVGVATMRLGRFLAPHIQKQGTRLLTTGSFLSEQEAHAKVEGVLTVAAGAVEGFSTIYHGLENSAEILGKSFKDNTVKVVEHRYGQPAGTFTADSLSTFGNVYQISRNAKIIRPTHLAKRAVKDAGKAFGRTYNTDHEIENLNLPNTSTFNRNIATPPNSISSGSNDVVFEDKVDYKEK